MEDLDLSSCSFLTDNEDLSPEKQIAQTEIQNLTLQNERLTEVNRQLQSSMETIKSQLRDALEAVNATKGLTEQIQSLKQQLIEANDSKNKLQEEIKQIAESGDDASNKLAEEISNLTKERDEALDKIRVITDQKNKLKSEKSSLKKKLDDQTLLNENLIAENDKLKANKKKQKAKMTELSEQISQLESAMEQINMNLQKERNEKTTLSQDLDAVRIQLSDAQQSVEEIRNKYLTAQKELEDKQNAAQMIENELDQQRDEIDNMSKEKQKIITLLHKMSAALSASEIKIESLQKENSVLASKSQKAAKAGNFVSRSDILELNIPYEGDLGEDCEKIMKLPQYQPIQRVQLIINESAKRIVEAEDNAKELQKQAEEATEKYNAAMEDEQKYVQLLDAILKDLKELSLEEQYIQRTAGVSTDMAFINYVTEKCSQLDPLIREKVLNDPHFISNDFFFTDDLTKKKKEIQTICEQNDTTFAILTAQFISNIILKRQLDAVIGAKEQGSPASQRSNSSQNSQQCNSQPATPVKEEISQQSLNEVASPEPQHVPLTPNTLQEKCAKAVKIAKQLKAALKKNQQTQLELQKADSEQKTQIAQLQIQCDNYKNELDVVNMKLQVANNELATKKAESSSAIANQIKETQESQRKANEAKLTALEEELRQKTNECNQLGSQLRKQQGEYETTLISKSKQHKKQEDVYKREIISLHDQIDALMEQKQAKKKQQRKKDKQQEAQYEAKIQELNRTFEETKANLNTTIEQLKDKAQQAHNMSQKLIAQMAECEKKNQEYQQENTALLANQKKVQVELTQMKQQISKEKQHLQGQLSAQMMIYDTKLQKATKEAKEEAEKAVTDLLHLAQSSLGAVYDLEDGDFTEETFKQLISLVKADLDKLHYFQSETTKFTVEKKK